MRQKHTPLAAGVRIDGFVVSRVVGTGGFGITYEARDDSLNRRVALKEYHPCDIASRAPDGVTLHPSSSGAEEDYRYGLERFLDEARVLAQFQSPYIVRVVRFLEAHGTAYLVMEFEEGRSLAEHIRHARRLPEMVIRPYAVAILRGLLEVHAKGYLHRDIKPANIIIREDGSPVLLDFGAERDAIGAATDGVTVIFTPGYAPMEQYATSAQLGPWTDIYAVGATLMHALTGVLPAAATDRTVSVDSGAVDPVEKVLELTSDELSDDFHRALVWMLKPRASERAQDAESVLAALGEPVSQNKTPQFPASHAADTARTRNERGTIVADFNKSLELVRELELLLEGEIGSKAQAVVRPAVEISTSYEELLNALAGMVPDIAKRLKFEISARALLAVCRTWPSFYGRTWVARGIGRMTALSIRV
jgi:serine/threonine protein kinase